MPRSALPLVVLAVLVLPLVSCGGSDTPRSEIAFVSTRDGDYAIYAMGEDGRGQHRLTPSQNDTANPVKLLFQVEPAWSRDGTRIAFSSRRAGSFDIYVMRADGTGTRRLTATKDADVHPTWSADGSRIAFARGGDIYVMRTDGGKPMPITGVSAEESDPAWSPDGRWIAYVRRTPGTAAREVWVMRPDGTGRRGLTQQQGLAYTPSWSPDSRRIVYSSNAEGEVYELYTIGIDGKGLRAVAPTASDDFEPSWSPDGTRIAYQEEGAIFSVELGGGDVEKLTDNETNDSSPAWNPVPPRE